MSGYDILTSFDKIYLQISEFSTDNIILAIIVIVVVVVLIIMSMILLNRRPSHKSSYSARALSSYQPRRLDFRNYPYNMYMSGEGSPIATVLEMLRRDLEDLSRDYSSGHLKKKDYEEKMTEIKKTLQDLKELREIIPETKKCNRCNTEILRDATFCDRCGTKQS